MKTTMGVQTLEIMMFTVYSAKPLKLMLFNSVIVIYAFRNVPNNAAIMFVVLDNIKIKCVLLT